LQSVNLSLSPSVTLPASRSLYGTRLFVISSFGIHRYKEVSTMKKYSILTTILVLVSSSVVFAGELPQRILMDRPTGAPLLEIPHFDRIDTSLHQDGVARVIVRLTPPADLVDGFAVESRIKERSAVTRQRAAISRKQIQVLGRVSQKHGARAKRFDFVPFMALEVNPDEFLALTSSPDIDFIQEDVPVPPTLMDSVPLIGGIGGTFSGASGAGQVVAILDSGVDRNHPFLAGKVIEEACYSTTDTFYPATTLCPNGLSSMIGSGAAALCGAGGCYHGTHVAGIAAGANAGFSGVAKDAAIIAIQVFSKFTSTTYCGATVPCVMSFTSDQISAMNRVYDLRNTYSIAAVNLSLGGDSSSGYCDSTNAAQKSAIDTLRGVGIATVIASGNSSSSSSISEPACISTAISVGATTKSDVVASYSNSAAILNLLAPGSSIYSSMPGTGYAYLSGTSMATPHVTGAWAVLKSAKPTATVTEVLNALTATGVSIRDTRNTLVKPRIKLDAAVTYLVPPPPPTVVSTDPGEGATGVPVTSSIKATFNTALKADTITSATFTVNNGVIGSITYDAATYTATFTPSVSLSPATTYTATITTGVTDAAGTPLAAGKSWSFTTQPTKILSVASVNPSGGVSVTVNPTDIAGAGTGSTLFTRTYLQGTVVSLTAAANVGGNVFNAWTGCDSFSGTVCSVTLTADRTVSATYVVPTTTVTVQTSPVGLEFSADGSPGTAPHTFTWEVGSSHPLATVSLQTATSGARYSFVSWSDGGALAHTVTIPAVATTYTANFAVVPPLVITSTAPPATATVGTGYSATFTVTGGIAPYTWQVLSGTLPEGLSLSSSGVLSGTPTSAGSFTFTVQARDSVGTVADTVPLTVTVTPAVTRINVAVAANGGVATASSVYNVNYPVAAVNNSDRKGVKWGAGGGWNDSTNTIYPDWVQVTFNGHKSIDEIDVFTLQDNYTTPVEPTTALTFSKYGITAFDVQYWDGSAWVTVPGGNITGNNLVWRTVTFPAVTTDRIRVMVNASRSGYSRITEIEAYGAATDGVNVPPTVTLTAPANGASYTAPATITLTATAADSDGTVAGVEFYNGATLLSTATTAPYSFTWAPVAVGTYILTAKAIDNLGAATTSTAVTITVAAPAATGTNVALAANGGVATASSVYNANYPIVSVNNGDRKGLKWGAGGGWNDSTNNIYPDWVQITFIEQKNINEIDVFTLQDNYPAPLEPTTGLTFTKYGITAFDVQYWDGAIWVTVPGGSITGNNLVWRTVTFPVVVTDRVRVLVKGSLAGYSRITEIEAYTGK
jgi:subtilisin family serine protease